MATAVGQEQESDSNTATANQTRNAIGISLETLRERSTEIFGRIDMNEDESVTVEELWSHPDAANEREISRRLSAIRSGFPQKREEIDVFDASDLNNNGQLSREEYDNREESVRKHVLRTAFDEVDTNKNGKVSLAEFNARIDEIATLDEDDDGILTRAELQDAWDSAEMVPGMYRPRGWSRHSSWRGRSR